MALAAILVPHLVLVLVCLYHLVVVLLVVAAHPAVLEYYVLAVPQYVHLEKLMYVPLERAHAVVIISDVLKLDVMMALAAILVLLLALALVWLVLLLVCGQDVGV